MSGTERITNQLAGHRLLVRGERLRRRWPLRELARRSGLSIGFVHAVERGQPASLASYVAIGNALGLRPAFELVDPRRTPPNRQEDPVHAAMGEAIAALERRDFTIALDDPYQHYQFAGRADLLAWSVEQRALLHVENRTRFPNLQEAFGSYNAKRRYLPSVLAERMGLRGGFDVVTNVVVALWSSELLHDVRIHRASFRALCPDPPDDFTSWWSGTIPRTGAPTSALVFFDPIGTGRSDRRRYIGLDAVAEARGRYRDYAGALDALRAARRA